MIEDLKNKTKQIVEIVSKEEFDGRIGLLSGTAGSLFLLCYYSEYSGNQSYLNIVEERILKAFEIVNNEQFSDLAFSNGITGLLWALKNLGDAKYIDLDLSDITTAVHPILNEFMQSKIQNEEYDFLHGALGVANYFLDMEDASSERWLKEFNQKFFAKAIKMDDTISFLSKVNIKDQWVAVVNTGLSHGMASIIYYLQRCLKNKNLASEEVKNTLQKIIAFYKKNQHDPQTYHSYFPSWIKDGQPEHNSRLAWCYGDLGIATAFLLAADVLDDKELKTYALAIAKQTITRLDPVKEVIREGGVCHGSAGLVKMYRNLFRITGLKEFGITADYWLNITLKLASHPDGHAGYKTHYLEKGFVNECGLLEGITGIGIVFIEELMGKPLTWEKSLMLA